VRIERRKAMKLSNEKILADIAKLREISKKVLPIKASYAIAKNMKKIEDELEIYYKEREKLIDKYAEKDENGNVKIDETGFIVFRDKESWDREIKELLAIENDIEIHKFPIDVLEGYNMSPVELMLIEYMIEE
jgi:hypothetical protein